jgi:hypothetical protein
MAAIVARTSIIASGAAMPVRTRLRTSLSVVVIA